MRQVPEPNNDEHVHTSVVHNTKLLSETKSEGAEGGRGGKRGGGRRRTHGLLRTQTTEPCARTKQKQSVKNKETHKW